MKQIDFFLKVKTEIMDMNGVMLLLWITWDVDFFFFLLKLE